MTFYLVMNGAGRRPHVETVETTEDVRARLEIEENPNDIVVIEGELVKHYREEYLFLEDQTIKLRSDEEEATQDGLPSWIRKLEMQPDTPKKYTPADAGGLPDWIRKLKEEADEPTDSEAASAPTGEAEHPADVEEHTAGEADPPPGDGSGEGPDEGRTGEGSGGGVDDEG